MPASDLPHDSDGRHAHDGHDQGRRHQGRPEHHGDGHVHAPRDFGRAFAIGTALNLAFVVAEASYGWIANSMALIADAGHNLSDVFGLLLAWGAAVMAKRAPSPRYTYGLRFTSVLAALANAILLLIAVGAIALEAVRRLLDPEPVLGATVIVVAAIGIVINTVTALMFVSGGRDDINVRGAYLHMAADAAVSLGVLLAGVAMLATSWRWIDPVVSLVVAAVIVWGTWSLLRDSVNLALQAVPAGIDPGEVRTLLAALPGVSSLHDLHIWPVGTTETALTCHLMMPAGHPGDAFLARAAHQLADRFGIRHATLQIETGDGVACTLAPDEVL